MEKRNLKEKLELFDRLKGKGVFWSYAKSISYADSGDFVLCEYALKYGDFEDLKALFSIFGETKVKRVWEERLVVDKRFQKLNLFLARVFLGMDVESSYFERDKSARFEKFRLLAS